jgi:SAM-dependent methyltransferase
MVYKTKEYYEQVSDYDLESMNQSKLDIPFWNELIKRYMPRHVLELACGSGRIGIELLHNSETLHLEGLDINETMLAMYRQKLSSEPDTLKQRVILHQADMSNYNLEKKGKFDLIFLPYNSLGYLHETTQQLNTFRKAYEHLAVGGRFVIDIILSVMILGDASPRAFDEVIEAPDGTVKMLLHSIHQYDRHKQIDHVTLIREKFFSTGQSERYLLQNDLRKFFPGELQLLFLATGFDIEAIYGDYSWGSFEQGTRQIIIGVKTA